ncbi:MAG: tetratricopeptide repeat protein [bacterium]
MVFWILVLLVIVVLMGTVGVVVGELFSEEKELINEAEQKIEQGAEREAASLLSRVTELNPANFQARWRLAKLMQMLGNYSEASEQFEYCLENEGLPSHVRRQDALSRLAQVYESSGKKEDAIDAWSRYLMEDPESMEGYFRRGKLYFDQNEYERAQADFEQVLEEFEEPPDQAELYLARTKARLEEPDEAIKTYERYLGLQEEDLEAAVEMAQLCVEEEQYDRAIDWYDHVREKASQELYLETTYRLIDVALEQEQYELVDEYMEEIEQMKEEGEFLESFYCHDKYARARYLRGQGNEEDAMELFIEVYQMNPNFRNVADIVDEQIGEMDQEELINAFMSQDRAGFTELSETIVEMMGYEVLRSESFGPDEVNVSAQEQADSSKVNRILFSFKRWDNKIGEWPIKEFELEILENHYDRGIFVAPYGFKTSAKEYAEQAPIRLIGPETLIQYVREAQKQQA